MTQDTKIKVTNPNGFMVGLVKLNDIEVTVRPNSFVFMTPEDIYYAHSRSNAFTNQFAVIEHNEINEELGLPLQSIATLTDEEITALLKGTIKKMKDALPEGTEKHLVDRIVKVALGIEDLAKNKIEYLEETFGVNLTVIEQLDAKPEDKKAK